MLRVYASSGNRRAVSSSSSILCLCRPNSGMETELLPSEVVSYRTPCTFHVCLLRRQPFQSKSPPRLTQPAYVAGSVCLRNRHMLISVFSFPIRGLRNKLQNNPLLSSFSPWSFCEYKSNEAGRKRHIVSICAGERIYLERGAFSPVLVLFKLDPLPSALSFRSHQEQRKVYKSVTSSLHMGEE